VPGRPADTTSTSSSRNHPEVHRSVQRVRRATRPFDAESGRVHLLVRTQAARAAAVAEPLGQLPAGDLLNTPVLELLQDPAGRAALERHVPGLVQTEQLTLPPTATPLRLARLAIIPAATRHAIAEDFAALQKGCS
jgi:hypothetical protein